MSYEYKTIKRYDENGIPFDPLTIVEFSPESKTVNREIEISGACVSIRWRTEKNVFKEKGILLSYPTMFEKAFNFISGASDTEFDSPNLHRVYQYDSEKKEENEKC